MNNFLAPIQIQLSPNVVSYTLGHRGRGVLILEDQRSRSVGEVCALLIPYSFFLSITAVEVFQTTSVEIDVLELFLLVLHV